MLNSNGYVGRVFLDGNRKKLEGFYQFEFTAFCDEMNEEICLFNSSLG